MVVGKEADCGQIREEKSKNVNLGGEGKTVRKKMNAIGKCSGLLMKPQRKEQKGEVMG